MPEWYRERPPTADLTSALACVWRANVGDGAHTLIPDGCVDLLWIDDGTVWLCGPETSAWSFSLPPGTTAVGARFKPGVAPRIVGLDAAEVSSARITLEALWGDRATRELAERVAEAEGPASRVAVLQSAVRHRRAASPPVDPVASVVADRVAMPGPLSVRALADDVGLSERQLRRRCLSAFGYGPTVLARILRLQRFLAAARAAGHSTSLAELALMTGYADQPHLSREVRAIADTTPSALVAS